MRLDHTAFRVKNRHATSQFFIQAFGYKIQTEFDINFHDGSTAKCIALEPPEKVNGDLPWTILYPPTTADLLKPLGENAMAGIQMPNYTPSNEFHCPPEIFVSDGTSDSIVGKWVEARGNVGGIHHLAYQLPKGTLEAKVEEWRKLGYAEFATEQPLTCPGIKQIFTKPSTLTGVIFEFIEREEHGFCQANVKELMISTEKFM